MRSLVELCQRTGVPFKVLPSTADILDGNVSISRIRDVDPVDLWAILQPGWTGKPSRTPYEAGASW